MIRMAETQPHKGIHRLQHYYWPVLYSLCTSIGWPLPTSRSTSRARWAMCPFASSPSPSTLGFGCGRPSTRPW
jgi:hypothetical protein